MYDKITDPCKYLLNNFPEAQNCLNYLDSRLTKESQELFQFGYFPNVDNLQVLTMLIDEKELVKENLISYRYMEDALFPRTVPILHFENYPLIIPFRDAYGRVIDLIGRTILSEDERTKIGLSKYKYTIKSPKGKYLFGLYENKQNIMDKNSVYIVEGQFDVIKATEKGLKNIVAINGSSMTNYQFSIISRYTDNIFLLLDSDNAGEQGRKNAIDKFGKLANIKNFYLPYGYKDIDEYLNNNDLDSLSFRVEE